MINSTITSNELEALKRAETLLQATYKLLQKQENSSYVLNLLAENVYYYETDCDGACLMDDIRYWFDEFSVTDLDGGDSNDSN